MVTWHRNLLVCDEVHTQQNLGAVMCVQVTDLTANMLTTANEKEEEGQIESCINSKSISQQQAICPSVFSNLRNNSENCIVCPQL